MTRETTVRSHTRKKPEPSWKSGPFASQIAARLEAKRSRAGMPAKEETQPVANVVPMRPGQMLMVCVAKINELIGRV